MGDTLVLKPYWGWSAWCAHMKVSHSMQTEMVLGIYTKRQRADVINVAQCHVYWYYNYRSIYRV